MYDGLICILLEIKHFFLGYDIMTGWTEQNRTEQNNSTVTDSHHHSKGEPHAPHLGADQSIPT